VDIYTCYVIRFCCVINVYFFLTIVIIYCILFYCPLFRDGFK